MLIDDATEADVPEIAAIYNDVVATSTAVFSEELGFDHVGQMPGVARKFDRWVDLVLLQITL